MIRNVKEKIFDMVKHAYTTVPLYVKAADDYKIDIHTVKFEQLPILDKSYFINSGISTLSSEYIVKYMNKQLMWERTSGSTGKFCEIYWDLSEAKKSLLSLWCYRRKYYHILPHDKLCYFFVSDTLHRTQYKTKYILAFSRNCIYDGTLEIIYKSIINFNPVWMILQPSIAILLCNLVKNKRLEVPTALRYIEFTGEWLDIAIRRMVEEVFGCVTANQYGTKEVNSIAYECPEGNMHCMPSNVYVETIRKSGNNGEICVTSLQNRAMPFIRYNVGDRGHIITNIKCKCGNCNNILKLDAGRKDDWIKNEDGSFTHAYAIIQLMHRINYKTGGKILQFQVVQSQIKQFLVKLVINSLEFQSEITGVIKQCFCNRLGGDVDVVVKAYKELLPDESTGKLASFISEI